ncbi:snake venom 5'-nucleotidase-like [Saccostrea echinata]|uniref:snake venom 5'-nucleotidase-like n=1 Tax=Saccostrea echinata TaxID=191078 RepID=UPI002A81C550|nr:snake venom 5'-nucleotidase-like [Saccostrea echinata]
MTGLNLSITGLFCVLSCYVSLNCSAFDLTLLHTNDVHARVQEMNAYGGQCTSSTDDCYGGVARMKTKVQEIRNQFPNTLLLDAGDQYQGTLWFNHYGGNITQTTMNELGYEAMALGNHEFDRKIEGLLLFLKNVNFPVLSANINTSQEPSIAPYISKSSIIQVGGQQIGIVGYTTKDTPIISSPGSLNFYDEVESVRSEVQKLTGQGVNKIIALGHAGFEVDKRIAEIASVDIVIGGHTNTFLYSGSPPSVEKPAGEYPHVVQKSGGEQTLVVQDYAFGKYLGFLQVEFDNSGKIINYGGNPILLNKSITENSDLKGKIGVLYSAIEKSAKRVVGRTLVTLEGETPCRLRECNMGNAIADGLVYHNLKDADDVNGTRVYISLVNAGSIRATFSRGQILMGNIFEAQPFRNTLETILLQGKYLRATLEHSASLHSVADPDGGFLQVSGLRVKYNLNRPVNQRVVDVKVICADCNVPKYEPLDNSKMYGVILSNFILSGGDGYTVLRDNARQDHVVGNLDTDAFAAYVTDMSPLYTAMEGRIEFVDENYPCSTSGGLAIIKTNYHTIVLFLLIMLYHL